MSALQPSTHTRIGQVGGSFIVGAQGAKRPWRHPWFTQLGWSAGLKRWVAYVNPGLVNGKAPVARTTTVEQEKATGRDFGINPLSGQRYFSAHVFNQAATTEEAGDEIDVPLYLAPAIPLVWRNVGWDAPGSAVPEFFEKRGVAAKPAINLENLTAAEPSRPPGLRLLRECDLVLHQPRLALTSQIEITPGTGLAFGQSIVKQTLSLRSHTPGDVLSVFAGTFRAPVGFNPLPAFPAADFEEENWDELLIARVYLLSPVGAADNSEPDGTWLPFVKHELFWNLAYRTPVLRLLPGDGDAPFIPPLAGGAAQIVINYLTATLNDLLRQATNLIFAHSMAGSWWTQTGGGSNAEFPQEEVTTPNGAGFAHGQKLRQQQAAQRQADTSERLDPPFPYRARTFDAATLLKA